MGAADVVPGVSGGTMAFILGIYEELILSIRSLDLIFFKHMVRGRFNEALKTLAWRFLITLGLGILGAIFTLAKLLSWLLNNHPILIWSFFFGLILASILVVSRYLKKWTPTYIGSALIGAIGIYLLIGLVPGNTPNAPWFLFLSGAVAICAMILPGISGSFILVLLGKYTFVLEAVNQRELLTLVIVAAGAVLGLLTFVRLLNWLLKKYHDVTIALLTGLMFGSLRKVWPWKEPIDQKIDLPGHMIALSETNILPPGMSLDLLFSICLMMFGFALVVIFNHYGTRNNDG